MLGDFWKYPPHEDQPELTGIPELSLALKTSKGVVLIVGCSHSRVEDIVLETKKRLNANVELVAGGFHRMPYSAEYITRLAQNLKADLGVTRIAPSHCTGVTACKIFKEVYGENYSYAGLEACQAPRASGRGPAPILAKRVRISSESGPSPDTSAPGRPVLRKRRTP